MIDSSTCSSQWIFNSDLGEFLDLLNYRPGTGVFSSMSRGTLQSPTSIHTSGPIGSSPSRVQPFNPHQPHIPRKFWLSTCLKKTPIQKKNRTFHQLSPSSKKKSCPTIKAFTWANYYIIIPKPEIKDILFGIPFHQTIQHPERWQTTTIWVFNLQVGQFSPFWDSQPTIRLDKISSKCIKRSDSPSSIRSTGTPDLRKMRMLGHGRKPTKEKVVGVM